MTKRHDAKYKIDRRMGQNIWGRPKSPVNSREYGPGQHGQRRKGKLSDYGVQLKRQAEAARLLRQHHREAVPRHLRRSHPHEGRLGRQHDRPARSAASTRSSTAPSSCRRCSPPASSSTTATSR